MLRGINFDEDAILFLDRIKKGKTTKFVNLLIRHAFIGPSDLPPELLRLLKDDAREHYKIARPSALSGQISIDEIVEMVMPRLMHALGAQIKQPPPMPVQKTETEITEHAISCDDDNPNLAILTLLGPNFGRE